METGLAVLMFEPKLYCLVTVLLLIIFVTVLNY